MKGSIQLALVAVFAVAGITACTSTPAPQNNAAPPTSTAPQTSVTPTSETSSPPVTVVTEIVTHTVTNPPQPQAVRKVDHRIGYGSLKLGMSLDEARAAGLTDLTFDSDAPGACVADGEIAVSRSYGIERISLPLDAETSKGIRVGSTFDDVRRAHPNAFEHRSGWSATIGGGAQYDFYGDANEVTLIKLTLSLGDCANALL
jgi:hypothetical protein